MNTFTKDDFFYLCDHCGAVDRGPSGPQPFWNQAAYDALQRVTGDAPRGHEIIPAGLHPEKGPSYVGGKIQNGPHAGEDEPISHGSVCHACEDEVRAWQRATLARYRAERAARASQEKDEL